MPFYQGHDFENFIKSYKWLITQSNSHGAFNGPGGGKPGVPGGRCVGEVYIGTMVSVRHLKNRNE